MTSTLASAKGNTASHSPGPRGLPLLGNLPAFARDPLAFFCHLRDEHGDWARWRLGPKRCLLVSRPEDVNDLLAGAETTFAQADLGYALHAVLGEGVVTSTGEDWRRKRALVQPSVRPRQVRSYASTMVECADAVAGTWQDGQRIDVQREMTRLTQRIAVRTLFGVETAGREEVIARAMAVAQQEIGAELRGVTAFFPGWVPTPGRRRLQAAVAELDAEIHRIIDEHHAARAAGEERDDLLSRLLAARDEKGAPLSDKELRDEAVTLYIGGHETTSTTLTWTWHLLSGSPEARACLDAELAEVLNGRLPAFDDYARLPFTQALVKESLRLYPPIWLISGVARAGARLGDREVPVGTTVWASQWSVHRDPRLFPEPDAFHPERWDPDAPTPVPDHAWFPFGGGQRTCLGARFALVEAALLLAVLAQRWRVDTDPAEVKPFTGLTLQPSRPIDATVRCTT
ncbi:cytochrome P450 [Streptacidiphilus pinicola]|uniref:Cytochrome P450 n=1 Tax=Streptacidiphilus pinicola TaxID=2219663 RepID=A0A2X0KEX4_9ACTN|nr:cytochrome P450 [Streptacidiphilus pinicola]RAG85689.1 cytochrome P450 [Streptacidiphilus pinicola]